MAAAAAAQVSPGEPRGQGCPRGWEKGFLLSLACGFSSLGSFQPGKQGLARAACRAGPAAASLQTENGKSKAHKTPLIALPLAPATFPSAAHFLLRHPTGSWGTAGSTRAKIHTPILYFGFCVLEQSKSLETILKIKSQQHVGSLLRCGRGIQVPL